MPPKKKIDTSAAIREQGAASHFAEEELQEEKPYIRVNIFVPDREVYRDFQIFAASLGTSVSSLLYELMQKYVSAHRQDIEAERQLQAEQAIKRQQI